MALIIVLKIGFQGDNTGRQETHKKVFTDSKVLDSFLTLSYTHVEQKLKDNLINRGLLYDGVYEEKYAKDTELVVIRSHTDYAELAALISSIVTEAGLAGVQLELSLAMEKTRQMTLDVQRLTLEFEILKFQKSSNAQIK